MTTRPDWLPARPWTTLTSVSSQSLAISKLTPWKPVNAFQSQSLMLVFACMSFYVLLNKSINLWSCIIQSYLISNKWWHVLFINTFFFFMVISFGTRNWLLSSKIILISYYTVSSHFAWPNLFFCCIFFILYIIYEKAIKSGSCNLMIRELDL